MGPLQKNAVPRKQTSEHVKQQKASLETHLNPPQKRGSIFAVTGQLTTCVTTPPFRQYSTRIYTHTQNKVNPN
jgi:hypothetical protein